MLSDSFLSIVSKDCGPAELLVRARRKGDIERVFPNAEVKVSTNTDYRFRSVVKRWSVILAFRRAIRSIDYGNFKDSVADKRLHDAYLRVWNAMADLQPTKPYSTLDPPEASEAWFKTAKLKAPAKRKPRRKK